MKTIHFLAFALLLSIASAAQTHETGASHSHDTQDPTAATQALPLVEAVVRTVDKSAKKITLKHGDIPNLDMGPMTMVFQVRDPALLDKVKAGDSVRFTADKIKGAYTVLTIDAVQK